MSFRVVSAPGLALLTLFGCSPTVPVAAAPAQAEGPSVPAVVGIPAIPRPWSFNWPPIFLRFADGETIVLESAASVTTDGSDLQCTSGKCTTVSHRTSTGWLTAYDPTTLARLWNEALPAHVGNEPLGAVGSSVVLAWRNNDDNDDVIFADRRTGTLGRRIHVPGSLSQVPYVCGDPSGARMWTPFPAALVDVATGDVRPAPRPAWCTPPAPKSEPPYEGHVVGNTAVSYVLSDGRVTVGIGVRAHGRQLAAAVGLAKDGNGVLWETVLPSVAEAIEGVPPFRAQLAGGRLVVAYDDWINMWKIDALDVATGARAWSVRTGTATDFAAGDTAVYVTTPRGIAAYDLQTGGRRDQP